MIQDNNINSKILTLLIDNRFKWFKLYELHNELNLSEKNELEEWIEKFCSKNEIKKSSYIKKLSASEVLNEYVKGMANKEIIYTLIENKKVSFNSFNLINNIAYEKNQEEMIIDILLKNNISNRDLHYSIKNSENITDIIKKLELIINIKKIYKSNVRKAIFKLIYNFKIDDYNIDLLLIENSNDSSSKEVKIHTFCFQYNKNIKKFANFNSVINSSNFDDGDVGEILVLPNNFQIMSKGNELEIKDKIYIKLLLEIILKK